MLLTARSLQFLVCRPSIASNPTKLIQLRSFHAGLPSFLENPQSGSNATRSHAHSPTQHSHTHSGEHSHSHTHSLTGELLSTGKVGDPAVRITLIGFVTNVGMAIGKGVGGVVFNSQSLIADAFHAVSDLISDVLTLATVSVTKRPPSVVFPNGYGRIEAVGAFGVSSLLLFAGVSMGWTSLVEISASLGFDLVSILGFSGAGTHSHSHKLPAEWNAAYIALASIAIKEALYQATKRVAERENSPVLLANAWHHRVDCMVSVVAVTSISVGQLLQAAWVDPLGGLLVSALIVRAGWAPAKDAALELCGNVKPALQSPKYEEFESAAREELKRIASGYEIVRCTLEPYGSTFVGSIQLRNVDSEVEQVADQMKQKLMQLEHMRQVYVRI